MNKIDSRFIIMLRNYAYVNIFRRMPLMEIYMRTSNTSYKICLCSLSLKRSQIYMWEAENIFIQMPPSLFKHVDVTNILIE